MNKLNVADVVKDSISLYKERWKPLLLISLMNIMISVFTGIFGIVIKSVQAPRLEILLLFINLIITLVALYFTSRFSVAMIIVADKSLSDEELTASHSYHEAKHITWRYIGIILLIGLMLVIPIMLIIAGVVLGVFMSISQTIRTLLIVMGALPAIYISIIFFFATYTVVLHPEQSRVFTCSRQLVKGNFFKVLIIQMIPLVILIPLTLFNLFLNINELSIGLQITNTIVQSIPSMLLMPFVTLNAVIAMKKLEAADENEYLSPL